MQKMLGISNTGFLTNKAPKIANPFHVSNTNFAYQEDTFDLTWPANPIFESISVYSGPFCFPFGTLCQIALGRICPDFFEDGNANE